MIGTDAATLSDVLEVEPEASLDELRAAVERARETFGPESIAVYALVDESKLDELRTRLAQAAEVLLDPGRRASYDRSIGRIGPSTLWAEDDVDDAEPLPPLAPGPHVRNAELQLEADEAENDEEEPRQQALGLDLADTPGPFGRRADAPPPAPEPPAQPDSPPLLEGDWAAAVVSRAAAASEDSASSPPLDAVEAAPGAPPPEEVPAASGPEGSASAEAVPPTTGEASARPERAATVEAVPASGEAPGREEAPAIERSESRANAEPVPPAAGEPRTPRAAAPRAGLPSPRPGRTPPPPSLGFRIRPGSAAGRRPGASGGPRERAASEHLPGPAEAREPRPRLEIASDAEFTGELLRRVRESYGLSIQQVAERTRITRIHLENVEADRYDRLPATVYLRGILVNLARELRLDPARVSKTYLLAAQRGHARAT